MTTSRTKTTSRAKTASRVQSPAPSAPVAPIRLSDAALLLLGQAAAREDRLLLPPPPALRARGSVLQKVLQALLKAELVTEVPVANEAQSWRSGDDGERIGLVIAAEGFRAIGLQVPAPAAPAAALAAGQGAPPAAEAAGRTTKQAVLIALLSDEAGASAARHMWNGPAGKRFFR